MERWPKIPLALLCGAFLVHCYASDVVFFESFDETFEKHWTVSDKEEYTGVWEHAKSEGHNDYGLLVSEKARKYGIVKELDNALNLKDGTVILQYEVRFQKGVECGGAYMKFLQPQEAGWTPKEFNNSSPYSIMFGPDKCGMTNKVHFIFRHKNLKSGLYVEHHLKSPPSMPTDKLTHVYTAIMKPGNKLRILVDGEEKKRANFLSEEDFEPPLLPPKTIVDPDDEKPEDWDEREKVPDPDAVKPEDWDENAPMEIVDEHAVMPEGWLVDEPEEIDDPDATKPEDWDEEEDGAWEAPKIVNPKCELAPGCGEWTRPMTRNPAYKGKWYPPLIENPNYKGIWAPRQIPNPHYFELEKPEFEDISAVGIEIWTMHDGILFDNILIAREEASARSVRETLWLPKFEVEKQAEKASAGGYFTFFQKKLFALLYKLGNTYLLGGYRPKVMELILKAEDKPNVTTGILVAITVLVISVLFKIYSSVKKQSAKVSEKGSGEAAAPSSNQGSSEEKSESEKDDASVGGAPRKRSAKKAD